jgi:hypothetical protein
MPLLRVGGVVNELGDERALEHDNGGGEEAHDRMEGSRGARAHGGVDIDSETKEPANAEEEIEIEERLAVVGDLVIEAGLGLRERAAPPEVGDVALRVLAVAAVLGRIAGAALHAGDIDRTVGGDDPPDVRASRVGDLDLPGAIELRCLHDVEQCF